MSKKVQIVMALIPFILQAACSSKEAIRITQIDSNYPIVIVKGRNVNRISNINFPLAFHVSKLTTKQIGILGDARYHYNNLFSSKDYWMGGCLVYIVKENKLQWIRSFRDIHLGGQDIIAYTSHRSKYDENSIFGQFFQSYLDRMIRENKDTLHIASIQELKKTNEDLINAFLQGDSIRFILCNDKCTIGTYSYPIEVK